ncbi:MAG: choice-of-anchor D domain-containing protein, partial [Acidocella sp.]|nr:choice-of-anchor D domain-containing protein [Acidocella sp.]
MTVTDEFKTQTVVLNGTGTPPPGVTLAPSLLLNFGLSSVGIASPQQTVTLTNNTPSALLLSSIAATGDFSLLAGQNTCPVGSSGGLAPKASCTVQMVFTPTVGGVRNGVLTVAESAYGSAQTLSLTGTGVDFQWTANGPTSVTVASGQTAAYSLTLASPNATTGLASGQATAAIACTGAPAHATCSLKPTS